MKTLDTFTEAYIECALWSTNDESTPEGGVPLEDNYGPEDIHPDTLDVIVADCQKFQEENPDDINLWNNMAGHNFWLTRNGHGAGFLDESWRELIEKRLAEASEKFGEFNLYVDDSGRISH